MPLNILVLAVPQDARDTATWLRSVASPAESSTSVVHNVRSSSEADWTGQAGETMRTALSEVGCRGDAVVEMARSFADALNLYADGIDTVHRRMHHARQVAIKGGLTVTSTEIHDPPSWTADPGKGGPGYSLVENQPDHDAKVAARQAKIDAYREAEQHVKAGRDTQLRTESALEKFISSQFEKGWVTVPTAISGWAGVYIQTNATWKATAASHARMAVAMQQVMEDPLTPAATRQEMLGTYIKHKVDAENPYKGSAADRWPARTMDKLPGWLQKTITSGIGPEHFRLNFGGAALSGVSAGIDIASGKDPGKVAATSTTSTVASMTAAGVGTITGGGALLTVGVPLVAGTVVATGAGWVYDKIASGQSPSWTTDNGQFRTPPMSR